MFEVVRFSRRHVPVIDSLGTFCEVGGRFNVLSTLPVAKGVVLKALGGYHLRPFLVPKMDVIFP